jgi:hypothetical protein
MMRCELDNAKGTIEVLEWGDQDEMTGGPGQLIPEDSVLALLDEGWHLEPHFELWILWDNSGCHSRGIFRTSEVRRMYEEVNFAEGWGRPPGSEYTDSMYKVFP